MPGFIAGSEGEHWIKSGMIGAGIMSMFWVPVLWTAWQTAKRMGMEEIKPFRIAFRREGEFVNIYLAAPTTMEEALHLASIHARLISQDWAFDEYKALMVQLVAECSGEIGLPVLRVEEEPAPEHERAGHG